jgi:hypothetical protein
LLGAAVPAAALAQDGWTTVHQGHTTITNGRVHHNGPLITGSGRVVWQNRAVGRFSRIELTGIGDADVRLGGATSVAIAADDNILPYLTTEVHGDTLKIGTRGGSFRTRTSPRLRITAPDISAIKAIGSGDIAITNVANRRLAVTLQGSGDLSVAGRTGELDLRMYGSGDSDTRALAASWVKVGIYGVGDARVRAAESFHGRVYGQGTVRFSGNPKHVNISSPGSGRIISDGGR